MCNLCMVLTIVCCDLVNSALVYIYTCIIYMYITYRYDDQLRVEYIVRCDEEELAYFDVTDTDIQGRDCPDQDGINR